jgi:uncharacterized protein (TIGR02246 family)
MAKVESTLRVVAIVGMLIVSSVGAGCTGEGEDDLSQGDIVAMRNLNEVYTTAWLDNDQEAVMEVFTEDAVLIPHHGAEAVVGDEAIRGFFWPADGPAVDVTEFTLRPDEITGNDGLGMVRGRFSLSFSLQGEKRVFSNDGNYVMILRRRSAVPEVQ